MHKVIKICQTIPDFNDLSTLFIKKCHYQQHLAVFTWYLINTILCIIFEH